MYVGSCCKISPYGSLQLIHKNYHPWYVVLHPQLEVIQMLTLPKWEVASYLEAQR